MSIYPEVQKKAQEELDRVVGPDRLPEFNDYEHLIYIQATMLESIRWIPVTPLGVPHSPTRDDEYRGYHIPKGATILPVNVSTHCDYSLLIDIFNRTSGEWLGQGIKIQIRI